MGYFLSMNLYKITYPFALEETGLFLEALASSLSVCVLFCFCTGMLNLHNVFTTFMVMLTYILLLQSAFLLVTLLPWRRLVIFRRPRRLNL